MAAVDVGIKGAIITGGLGRSACGGLITTFPFQVLCTSIPIPPTPVVRDGGGGSIPLRPGEVQNLYKPVDPKVYVPDTKTQQTEQEGEFVDLSVYGKRQVTMTVTSRFFEGEKEFIVPEKRYNTVFKVLSIINKTMERMSIVANNIKSIASRAKVTLKNFRRHK